MSLNKWKLILASLSVALFTACAGSSDSGSSDNSSMSNSTSNDNSSYTRGGSDDSDDQPAPEVKKQEAPKEVFDEAAMKKAQNEAAAVNEENHKVRKDIFDAKNKLGMPIEAPAE